LHDHDDDVRRIDLGGRTIELEVFEDGVPPRFRMRVPAAFPLKAADITIETARPDGASQRFTFVHLGDYLESSEDVPEPHEFRAAILLKGGGQSQEFQELFTEHDHGAGGGAHHRDNNMRAAIIHVIADAAVCVLVIIGLLMARAFGWLWMDPLAGLVEAIVIANWSFGLLRDTGGILLDRMPDPRMADKVRDMIEIGGDHVTDLHLWRLGPGHLGAIVSVATTATREAAHYRQRLAKLADLSHVTVEVQRSGPFHA
jgi:cation diffusion facilitator family transporter